MLIVSVNNHPVEDCWSIKTLVQSHMLNNLLVDTEFGSMCSSVLSSFSWIFYCLFCSLPSQTNLGHKGLHCFQNCAGERYYFINFPNFSFSNGKRKWCDVCVPWAIESHSVICFLQHVGRLWVMYRSWEDLPKQENLLLCQCFSFFQMCQITVIISKMAFSKVSKFMLLFWYFHCISHTKHLLFWREDIPLELIVKKLLNQLEEIIKSAGVCSVLVSLFISWSVCLSSVSLSWPPCWWSTNGLEIASFILISDVTSYFSGMFRYF